MSAYTHYPTPPPPHYTASSFTPQYYSPISSLVSDAVGMGERFTVDEDIKSIKLTPPDQVRVDFPDTSSEGGNTMKCLEQTLLDHFGSSVQGASREDKLNQLRKHVVYVKGKLLKAGDKYTSPIVADTYIGPGRKRYYKFLVNWEIQFKINGKETVIKKTQWTLTGISQSVRFDKNAFIQHSHHLALLAVKTHLYIHKAAFNQGDRQHGRMLRCIKDIRQNDIIGIDGYLHQNRITFTKDVLNVDVKKDPDSSYRLDNIIGMNEIALSICVALKRNKDGKRVCAYIDQASAGRRPNEDGTKLLKVRFNTLKPQKGIIPLCQKRKQQANMMLIRGNPELSKHLQVLHATSENIEKLLESNKFSGTNSRNMNYQQVIREQWKARQLRLENTQAQLTNARKSLIGALEAVYTQSANSRKGAFSRAIKTSVSKKLSKGRSTENIITKLQGTYLSAEKQRRIEEALKVFETILENCKVDATCVHKIKRSWAGGPPNPSEGIFADDNRLVTSVKRIIRS